MAQTRRARALRGAAAFGLALALLALLGLGALPAIAGKPNPPAPPVDGGKVYSLSYVMNPDGSEKAIRTSGQPSAGLHGSEVWYLQLTEGAGTYPSGYPFLRVLLVASSGVGVELLVPPLVEPASNYTSGDVYGPFLAWATEGPVVDGKVSFLAKQWNSSQPTGPTDLAAAGLYAVEVDWPTVLATATTALPVVSATPLGFTPVGNLGSPDKWWAWVCASYDWSADGESVVFNNVVGADAVPGTWRTDRQSDGTWSPPFRLAPETVQGLCWRGNVVLTASQRWIRALPADTYTPSPATVLEVRTSERVLRPHWSPNGTHFVYGFVSLDRNGMWKTVDLYRATAQGTDRKNLTGDTVSAEQPVAWCAQ